MQPRFSHMLIQFMPNGFSQVLTCPNVGHVMFLIIFYHFFTFFISFSHFLSFFHLKHFFAFFIIFSFKTFFGIFLHFKSLIEILNLIGKYSIPRTLRCRVLNFFGDNFSTPGMLGSVANLGRLVCVL